MLDWLQPQLVVQLQASRLTVSEASTLFNRSVGAIYRDCQYLGIDTSVSRGGCLTHSDCWILYVFLCWKLHCQHTRAWWRGDRQDYEIDCQTTEQKLAYVSLVGGSREDFNRRFAAALDQKRIKSLPQGDFCYG